MAVLLLVVVGVIALTQIDDAGSTVAEEPDTAVTESPGTTTASERPSTTTASESPITSQTGTGVFLDELHLGDCFNDSSYGTSNELSGKIRRVDCGLLHDAEVFALVTLPGAPAAAYPGDDEVAGLGDEQCQNEFPEYVGIDYVDSRWEYGYYTPTEESWREVADRLVICYLGDPDFDKLEGSKRDSRT